MPDILDQIDKNQKSQMKKLGGKKDMLLKAELRDIKGWEKNARHDPDWLAYFLKYNIAEVLYRPEGQTKKISIKCTLSKPFINELGVVESKKSDKIKPKKPFRVYNVETHAYETINLDGWRIARFVTMITENAELLSDILKSCRR